MAFELESYSILRPTLWHLADRANLPRIIETGELLPASALTEEPSCVPRRGNVVGKCGVRIRNQDLLNEKSVEIADGTFEDFVANLNRRVFFWSGGPSAPVRSGVKAIEKYGHTDAIIRIPFRDLAKGHFPEFTECNSGATRMQGGKRVPRGSLTFQAASVASFGAADVVEVTFIGSVRLPQTTELRQSADGKWVRLFAEAG